MAVGEMIGAAIGILMLIIVAYLVVGSTLSTADLVVNTQKEVTSQNEIRLRTEIAMIPYYPPNIVKSTFNFSVNNTGSESISDFLHVDVYASNGISSEYQRYTYDLTGNIGGTWTIERIDRDFVHPQMLDPGESMWICATYSAGGGPPIWALVSTGNGVTAAGPLP